MAAAIPQPPPSFSPPTAPVATLDATLNYTRDDSEHGYTSFTEAGPNIAPTRVHVRNARQYACTLETHGFELRRHPTSLSTAEFHNDEAKVHSTYFPEIESVIKAATGATAVKAFHYLVRNGGNFAGVVHSDYTFKNAFGLFSGMARQEHRRGKFKIVNVWRSITGVPVKDNHLAMCDGRTIAAPDDLVTVTDPKGHMYQMSPGHTFLNEWYYYPDMVRDEVLLFTQFDSDTKAQVRYTFHSAMIDPTCPPGYPARQTIEVRALAFLPDFERNTIPDVAISADAIVNNAIHKIIESVHHAKYWDAGGRNWMTSIIHGPGGGQQAINGLIHDAVKNDRHNLKAATPEQVELVRRGCMAKVSEFEKTARENFPQSAVPQEAPAPTGGDALVTNAVHKILESVKYPGHWPEPGRKWLASIVHKPGGGQQAINGLIHDAVDKNRHELKRATPAQVEQVRQGCLAKAGEFESTARKNFPNH